MKIYEIAPGEKEHIPDIHGQADNFYLLVEQDCSEALTIMKETKKLLYRGVKSAKHSIFHGRSRDFRNPLDSSVGTQKTIDFYLQNSGFTALRSNSIFCTSKCSATVGYGTPYLIFPVDGFDFTWSEVIEDLVFSKLGRHHGDDPNLVTNFKFRKDNFAGALMSGHEILIHGEYYACAVHTLGNKVYDEIFRNNA